MYSFVRTYDDSFHNYFINGDWNLDTIKNDFGDIPAILSSVLLRRSCSVDVIKLLFKHGADINCPNENGDFPLVVALEISNDEAVVRELLEAGAEVNKLDFFGRTPLLRYLQREDCSVGIVKVLLDFKADVNRVGRYQDSPLWTAIHNSNDDAVIQVLVEGGAEVNDFLNLHKTPLLVLLQRGKNCSVDTVKLMLAKGADVNCVDKSGCSPLMAAVENSREDVVIEALLKNGANIDIVCKNGKKPPIMFIDYQYFADNNCCIGVVKLLLRFQAEYNVIRTYANSPLMIALKNKCKKELIQVMLEAGAGVDTTPLYVFFAYSPDDIVKMLLEAETYPVTCKYHGSALHCATDFSYVGLREGILKLLLVANIDLNYVEADEQTVVCIALQKGVKVRDLQLLLDAGAVLNMNTCMQHSSPLICATHTENLLREDVVQFLLDNEASVNDEGLEVLQYALCSKYETGAIQLLLDLPGMNAYVVSKKLLLHHAVRNPNCRLDAIKLLVNRKAQVQSRNKMGETPLHCAVRNERCDPSVIHLLLKNGAKVNAKNILGETPLMVAVNKHCDASILKELLLAGAHIGKAKFGHGCGYKCELLTLLAGNWEDCKNKNIISNYKMLTKFFLLQNPGFNVENFQCAPIVRSYCIEKMKNFLNECLNELGKMDLLQIGRGRTIRMFISRADCAEKYYDANQILVHLVKNSFPVFFDVISARINRSIIEAELKKLKVCTHKIYPFGRIYMNFDILYKISNYLSNEALLNFILASCKPPDLIIIDEASQNETLLGKRKYLPSTELLRHKKSCR